MASDTTFTPQVLGETEKALNAILDRQLNATGLTEHQWITLRLTVIADGEATREQLVERLAGALKAGAPQAEDRVNELVAAGLLQSSDEHGRVAVMQAGTRLHARIRGAVSEITERLWGDLPAGDLETTRRTLTTILERANAHSGAE